MDANQATVVSAISAVFSFLAVSVSIAVAIYTAQLQRRAGRPQVRVISYIEYLADPNGQNQRLLAIVAINNSLLPITVTGVGLVLGRRSFFRGGTAHYQPWPGPARQLRQAIVPWDRFVSMSDAAEAEKMAKELGNVSGVWVRTADGKYIEGKTPADFPPYHDTL